MAPLSRVAAQDYTDIQNLYAYYNLCSDAGDAAGDASCFTPDGEMAIPALGLHVKGQDNLHAFKLSDKAQRGNRYRRHWNSGLYLEPLDDDAIRGRCYLQAYNGEPGQHPELADVGVYEDTLVRHNGEWRFAKRVITMDATTFKAPPAET